MLYYALMFLIVGLIAGCARHLRSCCSGVADRVVPVPDWGRPVGDSPGHRESPTFCRVRRQTFVKKGNLSPLIGCPPRTSPAPPQLLKPTLV